jgi:hypothetical protein
MKNVKSFEQILKEIGRDKNNSLMNYLQYRVLFNQSKRDFRRNVKVYFMDLKISLWAYLTGATVTYEKKDQVSYDKMQKDIQSAESNSSKEV